MTSLPGIDLGPLTPLADSLQEITEALAATGTQREVIEIILTPAVQALGAVAGTVLLVDQTDQQLKIAGSQGYEDVTLTLWQEGPIEDHLLISDILRMKEALYFEDAGALKDAYPDLEARTGGRLPVANATLPMFLEGQPLGIIVLDFKEPHSFTPAERRFLKILSAQCAVALGRMEASRTLEAQVGERNRQLEEERAAQDAFVAFTEAVGSETELPTLVGQAIKVLQSRFSGSTVIYCEQEDGLWKGRIWSDDLRSPQVAVVAAGVPMETPLITEILQTRQPVFTDEWPVNHEDATRSKEYGAAGGYPLIVNGELHWLLAVGLRNTRRWSETDKAFVRAVGRALNLALERTETTRQLTRQNAELQARTRALEAFAELTRDLSLTSDPLLLIRRAQEVVMSMLADGVALYFVPEGERWYSRVQYGTLYSAELQAILDAGLPGTTSMLTSWSTGQPYFQDVYDRADAGLPHLVGHISASVTLPIRVEGTLTGILTFLLFDQRTWTGVDRVVLETAVRSLELALDRARQAETLKDRNAELEARTQALEGFALLTREFSLEHDPVNLVGRAQELILSLLPEGTSTYYELQGDVWQLRSYRGDFHDLALLGVLQGGVARGTILNLERPLETRLPYYQGTFDIETITVAREAFRIIGATAALPVFVSDQVQGVLVFGLYQARIWSAADRAVLETVARSLGLALERSRASRELMEQRDLLNLQTTSLSAANEELEAFTYSASHDLRTPVRHVMGFTELAQKALADTPNEKAYQHMEVVKQGALRMTAMIDGMLLLSRSGRETLRHQTVDLNELVVQARRDAGAEFGAHPVRWHVGVLPQVWGDRALLQQVMTNLLSNAVKYSSAREVSQVHVWAQEHEEEWTIAVQDNGVGFNPDYAQKLFGIFQRLHTERQFKGTGVGLATVRRIILKHGGRVFAESVEHEGATFSFTLPRAGP
jgi:signal transduction histidine kinase